MSVDYKRYLASRQWAVKKKQVMARAEGMCERCHRAKATQVHHLTYEHIGNEPLEDLQALCSGCHEFLSAVTAVDPAKPQDLAPVITLSEVEPRLAQIVREMREAQAEGNRARVHRLLVEHHELAKETWRKYGRPA